MRLATRLTKEKPEEASCVSTFCTSPEKRLRMRPSGVVSKKDMGAASTADTAAVCTRRAALTLVKVWMTARSRRMRAAVTETDT